MTVFTEGRLRMYERMMRDTGERDRRDSCGRDRASDRKSAQRGAKKAVTGKRAGGQRAVFRVEKKRNFMATGNCRPRVKNRSLKAKGRSSM